MNKLNRKETTSLLNNSKLSKHPIKHFKMWMMILQNKGTKVYLKDKSINKI